MPRNLPWLTGGADSDAAIRSRAQTTTGVGSRARRKLELDSDDAEDKKAHQTSPYKKKTKVEERRRSCMRTCPPANAGLLKCCISWANNVLFSNSAYAIYLSPSSAPSRRVGSPLPPLTTSQYLSFVRYMRPGYRHDDLYRMVEDEFYTVAQQFTSHLHFAEYKRLKHETKQKSFDTIRAMRRPVDGKTPVSAETKRKNQMKDQARKTGKGVREMTGKARDDNDDDTEAEEVEEGQEPWVGTSLQGLMVGERKKPTALVGLEGVKSDTKASKGFGTPKKDKSAKSLFLSPGDSAGPSRQRRKDVQRQEENDDDDDDDSDDLGASTTAAAIPRLPPSRPAPPSATPTRTNKVRPHPSLSPSSHRTPEEAAQRIKEIFSPSKKLSLTKIPTHHHNAAASRSSTLASSKASSSSNFPSRHGGRPLSVFLDDDDNDDDLDVLSSIQKAPRGKERAPMGEDISFTSPLVAKMKDKGKGKGKAKWDDIPLFLG